MFLNIYLFLKNEKEKTKRMFTRVLDKNKKFWHLECVQNFGEIDYKDNHVDLDRRLCDILR